MIQCSQCGHSTLALSSAGTCEICGNLLSNRHSTGRTSLPWEQIGSTNLVIALIDTIKESMGAPSRFFKHIGKQSSLFHALLFGLIAGSISVLFDFIWHNSLSDFFQTLALENLGSELNALSNTPNSALLFTPLIILGGLFGISIYVHLLLKLTRGSHNTFRSTLITVSYTQSVSVLSIIPLLGNVIAPIWAFIILIIGISVVHSISKTRVLITLSLPIIFLCLLVVFILITAMGSTILLSTFLKDFLPFSR